MRIKIVSDGKPWNTQVLTEDGKMIEGIESLTLEADAKSGLVRANIVVLRPLVDVVAELSSIIGPDETPCE